jgi:predicted RNase H-like HicB family nuclease
MTPNRRVSARCWEGWKVGEKDGNPVSAATVNYNVSMHGTLTILYIQDETGMYTASIPEVPGAVSCGTSVEEARLMVLDALKELLEFRASESKSEPAFSRETLSFAISA